MHKTYSQLKNISILKFYNYDDKNDKIYYHIVFFTFGYGNGYSHKYGDDSGGGHFFENFCDYNGEWFGDGYNEYYGDNNGDGQLNLYDFNF